MEYPLEHHEVLTNGVRLHVVQCGPADGELVLLLHGFPEFWYGWRKQIPVLAAAGYRVWAPDQRGYNTSDKPAGIQAYGLPMLGADALGLLDAAGRQQAHLIGHDWGAIVSWYLAAQYQSRFASVSILNVPHPHVEGRNLWRVPNQLLLSWYMFFFQLPTLPERLFSAGDWTYGRNMLTRTSPPGLFSAADLARYQAAWAQPGAITAMINWYRGLRLPLGILWPRIKEPLQVIWGTKDAFLDARWAEISLEACDQGEVHYFPGVSHWVQLEEADAVNDLLLKFLAANPAV